MAFAGNTVRLMARFRDFDGNLSDATGIVLRIYDHRRNQIGADIAITASNRTSLGVYQYDYTIPSTATQAIIYEFSGMVGTLPSVGRGQIPVRWV
jgi:hypothetical protein